MRTSSSRLDFFRQQFLQLSTPKILIYYLLSAWWFAQVTIWSSPQDAELSWVKRGDMSTPDRLNERPIYLTGVFILLGFAQSIIHLYNDFSSLEIVASPIPPPSSPDQRTHRIASISHQLQIAVIPIFRRSIATSVVCTLAGPFIYLLCFRKFLWWWHLTFAKLWFNIPRSDARPTGYPPANLTMMLRSFALGFLLVLTWETSTFLFSALMTQQPLKKGQPLSAMSKDPNGTLLNGIKAKNDIVKTFAFWELALIARSFPERRKAIFADIERKDGTCWAQMQVAALDNIKAVSLRINPPDPAVTRERALRQAAGIDDAKQINALPQIAPPVSNKNIRTIAPLPRTQTEKLQAISGSLAKSLGQTSQPWSPPAVKVRDLLGKAKMAGVSDDQVAEWFNKTWMSVQESPVSWVLSCIGQVFTIPQQQQINAIVLGSGHASTALIVDSIESLTRMLVASLSDDVYGKANSGVPEVVRTMATAVTDIEAFMQQNGQGLDDKLEEVEVVVERLKAGLAELISAFQLYLSDVGLGIVELTNARHAAEKRRLIPTMKTQAIRGAPTAGESTDVTQKQATESMKQEQQNGDPLNGTTRGGSHRGDGDGGGRKMLPPSNQTQSKARRDWNGQSKISSTAFVV